MALTDALANASKKAQALPTFSYVMYKLHGQNRFTYAGTSNNANFASLYKRGEEVDYFDAGF